MRDQTTIRLLKIVMFCGISLIIFGHYLWVGLKIHESMGVQGIVIIAACCAFGLILSLPTKMYLTFLLMKHEAEQDELHAKQAAAHSNASSTAASTGQH